MREHRFQKGKDTGYIMRYIWLFARGFPSAPLKTAGLTVPFAVTPYPIVPMEKRGYTLSEIVVAIAISTLLLGGTIGLASRAIDALSAAKTTGQTHASLVDALSKLSTVASAFPSVRAFGS